MKYERLNMEKDKAFVEEIINLFLSKTDVEEIAKIINKPTDFVLWILNYRGMIVTHFGEEKWNEIRELKNEIKKQKKEEDKIKQYEHDMKNVLYYINYSFYSYSEMGQYLFMGEKAIQSMVSNTEYIEEKFGKQVLEHTLQMLEIRRKISGLANSDKYVLKEPEFRKIVRPDIIIVDAYEYLLIKKAALFLEYGGDSLKIAHETSFLVNDIMLSLRSPNLKNLLTSTSYNYLEKLLNVECILTQNKLDECRALVTSVVLLARDEHGVMENISEISEYPKCLIERILNHPYSNVVCNKYGIDKSDIELKEKDMLDESTRLILDIADYIIENDASYREAASVFSLGKTTIGKYMNEVLPSVSKSRYEAAQSIIQEKRDANAISETMKDRIYLEYELFMRGYNLHQTGYLVNNSYSSTQRDLANRLPKLDLEKAEEVKKVLIKNQQKLFTK